MNRTFFLSAMLAVIFAFSSCNAKSQNTTTEQVVVTQNQNQLPGINLSETKDVQSSSMSKAYELSESIIKQRLSAEDTLNVQLIDGVSQNDLVVVDGSYDHIHLVLSFLKLPFLRVSQHQVAGLQLEPHQTVFVNCAGNFPAEGARKLAKFVADGGQLITTDWALHSLLEQAFPGYVKYNQRPTADEVVRIEVKDKTDPVIAGFLDEETAPVWWLEGSSYPIKILNKDVKILISSKELKDKYGEEAVLVRFEYGKGVVYHMISHFYLQRTETKDAIQSASAVGYFNNKVSGGISVDEKILEEAKSMNYGEVQSANTSAEFIMRSVINQKKKNQGENKK